jgi:hypothetical protein
VGITIVAAVTGGGIAYAWHRATALPTWYEPNAVVPDPSISATELIASKLAADTDGDIHLELTLNETEINQIVTSALAENPDTANLLSASQGVKTNIDQGQIESGTVINLSEVPQGTLPPQGQAAVTQLTQRFPMLANRYIYIGIASRPQIANGRLHLGENAVIKIGGFSLPLSEVTSQLGISQKQLEEYLSQALTQQGISLQDIQVIDGQITLVAPR